MIVGFASKGFKVAATPQSVSIMKYSMAMTSSTEKNKLLQMNKLLFKNPVKEKVEHYRKVIWLVE